MEDFPLLSRSDAARPTSSTQTYSSQPDQPSSTSGATARPTLSTQTSSPRPDQPSSSTNGGDLGKGTAQPSWKSLFGSDPSLELQYCELVIREGKPFVKISFRNEGLALWDDSLIGQSHGPSPPLYHIQSVVNNL